VIRLHSGTVNLATVASDLTNDIKARLNALALHFTRVTRKISNEGLEAAEIMDLDVLTSQFLVVTAVPLSRSKYR
jgi:hypothetical protein